MDVYIAAAGSKENDLLAERMWVLGQLTRAGIRATLMRKAYAKLVQQLKAAVNVKAPITIILGPDELASGKVRLKVSSHPRKDEGGAKVSDSNEKGEKDRGLLVSRENLVVKDKRILQEIDLRKQSYQVGA